MHIKKILWKWLPLAATIIVLSGTAYVAVQQNYRMSANDQQIQIAEDAATALNKGLPIANLVPQSLSVDIDKTLSLNIGIYDDGGKPIQTSAKVDGKPVDPPTGVFDAARKTGQNRFTWQPKEGVRQAAVVVRFDNGQQKGFVLVARSLREVEKRISDLTKIVALGTTTALLASLLLMVLAKWMKKRKDHGDHDKDEKVATSDTSVPEHSDASDRREAEITNESNSVKQNEDR